VVLKLIPGLITASIRRTNLGAVSPWPSSLIMAFNISLTVIRADGCVLIATHNEVSCSGWRRFGSGIINVWVAILRDFYVPPYQS